MRTGARVREIVVRRGRAVAVKLEDGERDRGDAGDHRRRLRPCALPAASSTRRSSRRASSGRCAAFQHGFGTFRIDWALGGAVPWLNEDAARSAVVHAGDSLDDLTRFTREVRSGALPTNPYLVIGQQSLADPTRAPAGKHTLWAYSRVPSTLRAAAGRPSASASPIGSTIASRASRPGFKKLILARAITTPPDLQAMNENLVGGDITGGSASIRHQLFFRPVFPYFRYRTPLRALYLGSSYAHPGAGVHGACGKNAAEAALRDEG